MTLLIKFLTQVREFVKDQNGDELRAWLVVEPGSSQIYHQLAAEIRSGFPRQNSTALEQTIEKCLPEDDDVPKGKATPWPSLVNFIKDYLVFWRDVDFKDLLGAHTSLTSLVNSCGTAFAHPTYGGMLRQTAMSLCETLSKLTMMVSRRPELTIGLRNVEAGDRKSIAETTAEIIQKILTTCLTDRTSTGPPYSPFSKPEGKKIGVYMFANLVLKLLFACRRPYLAKQLFTNIASNSPPLSLYPASQRVTFLYYLGRFNLNNSHVLRAAICLEEAYRQTPPKYGVHRQRILTYLIPANLLIGRLPSESLLSQPEVSETLTGIYRPLSIAIKRGDFVLMQDTIAANYQRLFDQGILMALAYRLRPLIWRSLARKTFLLTYNPEAEGAANETNASARKAATLDLEDLRAAAMFQQRWLQGWRHPPRKARPPHVSAVFMRAVANDSPSTLVPPDGGPKYLRPHEGLIWGPLEVRLHDVEFTVANLISMGFMKGYIAHSSSRFAVLDASKRSPVLAGWPAPWAAIQGRILESGQDDLNEVPGWVKE